MTPEHLDKATWLELHRSPEHITASEVPIILGRSPFKSAYTLFQQKMGRVPREEDSLRFQAGKLLEPLVAQAYEAETGRKTVDQGEYTIVRHPDYPFFLCTLDRMDDTGRAVELKTANAFKKSEWDGTGPDHYRIQVQAQLACAELVCGSLAGLINLDTPVVRDQDRHDGAIKGILACVVEFRERLANDDPPPIDVSASTAKTIKLLHPKDNGETVYDDSVADAIHVWEVAKANVKLWEKEKKAAETRIKAAMGDATYLVADGYKLSWKHEHVNGGYRKAFDKRVLRLSK